MSVYLATGFSNVSFWLLYVVHFPILNVNINLFSRPAPTWVRHDDLSVLYFQTMWQLHVHQPDFQKSSGEKPPNPRFKRTQTSGLQPRMFSIASDAPALDHSLTTNVDLHSISFQVTALPLNIHQPLCIRNDGVHVSFTLEKAHKIGTEWTCSLAPCQT